MKILNVRGAAALSILLLSPVAGPAVQAEATPQRPSLSYSTATVEDGAWELEAGGLLTDGGSAVPLFLKYGWTDRLELEFGLDMIRTADRPGRIASGVGDLAAGMRFRFPGGDRKFTTALGGWLKVPTAPDRVGSGEVDATIAGILSAPMGNMSLDANLVVSALGRDGGSLGQVQGILTLGFPLTGGWSGFIETAFQRTAGQGDGGFFDAGLSFRASPRATIDFAVGGGWSDGYPDWSVTAGWTITLQNGKENGT